MGKIKSEGWHLLVALLFLFFMLPLAPTTLLLRPVSLSVSDTHVTLDREVLFPINAWQISEFERLVPPPPVHPLDCVSVERLVHYENRAGRPVVYAHGCDFGETPGELWQFRSCWQAVVFWGVRLRQSCETVTFYPNASEAIKNGLELQRTVEELNKRLQSIEQLAPAQETDLE